MPLVWLHYTTERKLERESGLQRQAGKKKSLFGRERERADTATQRKNKKGTDRPTDYCTLQYNISVLLGWLVGLGQKEKANHWPSFLSPPPFYPHRHNSKKNFFLFLYCTVRTRIRITEEEALRKPRKEGGREHLSLLPSNVLHYSTFFTSFRPAVSFLFFGGPPPFSSKPPFLFCRLTLFHIALSS